MKSRYLNQMSEADRLAQVFCAQQFLKFPESISPENAFEIGMTGLWPNIQGVALLEPLASRDFKRAREIISSVSRYMAETLKSYAGLIHEGMTVAALVGDLPEAREVGYHQLASIGSMSKEIVELNGSKYRLDKESGNWVGIHDKNLVSEVAFDGVFLPKIQTDEFKGDGMQQSSDIAQAFVARHFLLLTPNMTAKEGFNQVMASDELEDLGIDVNELYDLYDWSHIAEMMLRMSELVQDALDEYVCNIKWGVDLMANAGIDTPDIRKLNMNQMAGVGRLCSVSVSVDGERFKLDVNKARWVSQNDPDKTLLVNQNKGFLPLADGVKEIHYGDIRYGVEEREQVLHARMS